MHSPVYIPVRHSVEVGASILTRTCLPDTEVGGDGGVVVGRCGDGSPRVAGEAGCEDETGNCRRCREEKPDDGPICVRTGVHIQENAE